MNKTELIASISQKTDFKANKFVNAFIDTITDALEKGDKVQLIGFGTFEVRERKTRTSRNPKTGETIIIPAKKTVVFKAGKTLKGYCQ